ncbi:hypothetical protein COY62_00885 [bacterium (Candidatus Howlettbacteria) CG_4_10_14_0_8_um_filter_40_9]|nr:MAG: hypothetical protein COY62_00885 [bacterium (Candidatus Howlettbacteria) CG_4_10_14_0_8_um_filter_40_9]
MKIAKSLLSKTLRNTSLAVAYIFAVSQIMANGEKLFGNIDNKKLGPFMILLLFSLSAAIVSGLIFGQSIYLFLDNKKKESVTAAFYSIGWLALITILGLVSLALIK